MDSQKYVGKVVWFHAKRGYGFISRPNEKDIFVHWSDIVMENYKKLEKDQTVAYSIGLNKRGQLKATEVKIIPDENSKEEK